MAFTIGEVAKLTGITVRTLHHYDDIGLVRPSRRSEAGYRLYEEGDVLRLHQVLLFRELGIPLEAIATAIDDAGGHEHELLRRHREVLITKRARIDAMIAALDARLTRRTNMTNDELKGLFDGFDPSAYDTETEARWGDSDAFREASRRTKQYGRDDWARYKFEAAAIDTALIALMHAHVAVDDPRVQAQVEAHRALVDRWFYPCSRAMHRRLAALYTNDARFTATFERRARGYANYLASAIEASSEDE